MISHSDTLFIVTWSQGTFDGLPEKSIIPSAIVLKKFAHKVPNYPGSLKLEQFVVDEAKESPFSVPTTWVALILCGILPNMYAFFVTSSLFYKRIRVRANVKQRSKADELGMRDFVYSKYIRAKYFVSAVEFVSVHSDIRYICLTRHQNAFS